MFPSLLKFSACKIMFGHGAFAQKGTFYVERGLLVMFPFIDEMRGEKTFGQKVEKRNKKSLDKVVFLLLTPNNFKLHHVACFYRQPDSLFWARYKVGKALFKKKPSSLAFPWLFGNLWINNPWKFVHEMKRRRVSDCDALFCIAIAKRKVLAFCWLPET